MSNKVCELTDLYQLAEKREIKIFNFNLNSDSKALSLAEETSQYIGIDYKKINTYVEEKSVLAEEISHHEVGILPTKLFSNSRLDRLIRSKNEASCKKAYLSKLIHKESFLDELETGYYDLSFGYNISELAEHFNVTEDDILFALKTYVGD